METMEALSAKLDLEHLESVLSHGLVKPEKIKNKDITAFIGNLGAGKSTTIAYLLGARFIKVKQQGKFVAQIQDPLEGYPGIGHGVGAKTLYSEVYTQANNLFLCDTPGFSHNRSISEKIAISLNLEYMLKLARSVKIVVVLKYGELSGAMRGKAFYQLIRQLGKLLNSPESVSSFIYWIVTDVPVGIESNDIIEQIASDEGILSLLNSQLKELQHPTYGKDQFFSSMMSHRETEIDALKRQMQIIKGMCSDPRHIVCIDVTTDVSREVILKHLTQTRSILPTQFCFKTYDMDRFLFEEMINLHCHRLITLLYDRRRVSLRVDELTVGVKRTQEQNEYYEETQRDMLFEAKMLKETLEKVSHQIFECRQLASSLNSRLKELNTDELQTVRAFNIQEERHRVFGFLGYSSYKLLYSGGEPFTQVSRNIVRGYLAREEINKAQGCYSATFETNYGKNASAVIKLLIPKKALRAHASEIKIIKEELAILIPNINKLESISSKLKSQILSNDRYYAFRNFKKKESEELLCTLKKELIEQQNSLSTVLDRIENENIVFIKLNKVVTIMDTFGLLDQRLSSNIRALRAELLECPDEPHGSPKPKNSKITCTARCTVLNK